MLTEICEYLKNWFDRDRPKFEGTFTISGKQITFANGDMGIQDGQYIRVIGSVFNDGVWKYNTDTLTDETFDGAVWLLGIPPAIIALAKEIDDWQKKYGGVNSENMSPFSSESFAGYSYTKAQGFASTGGGMLTSWQSLYAQRLMPYKKLR